MAWKCWALIQFLFYSSICFFEKDQYKSMLKEHALENIFTGIADSDKIKASKGIDEIQKLLTRAKVGKK